MKLPARQAHRALVFESGFRPAVDQIGALAADTHINGTLTLNNDNQEQATRLRLSAKAYPFRTGGQRQNRVIALLTPA